MGCPPREDLQKALNAADIAASSMIDLATWKRWSLLLRVKEWLSGEEIPLCGGYRLQQVGQVVCVLLVHLQDRLQHPPCRGILIAGEMDELAISVDSDALGDEIFLLLIAADGDPVGPKQVVQFVDVPRRRLGYAVDVGRAARRTGP